MEKRLLELLVQGYAPKQIAPRLAITYHSFNWRSRIIRMKLRAVTTVQAVAIAIGNNLVCTKDVPRTFGEG